MCMLGIHYNSFGLGSDFRLSSHQTKQSTKEVLPVLALLCCYQWAKLKILISILHVSGIGSCVAGFLAI